MKKIIDTISSKPITFMAIIAVFINICIELISRKSIPSLASYIIETPMTFLFNTFIIMFTMSISLFFKRRTFLLSMISVLWLGLGIANRFMLNSGNMPLTICHIVNFGSAIKLSSIYMTMLEIILVFAAIIALAVAGFFLWKKMPKAYRNMRKAAVSLCILFAVCSLMGFATSATSPDFSNLPIAYEKYGFPYCFSYSVLNMGIERPDDYSEEAVSEITEKIDIPDSEAATKPNIIFIQLESFFDVKDLIDIELSKDPIPNFTKLKEDYPSGYLTVSSIGGGTSNTEFEVMSGLSLSHFGPGEYPYLTYLQENTCETIMRNLAEYGYTSTAMHSYTGTFYQRHKVLSKLGFDRFLSEEFMTITERNELSWVKDSQLLPYIRESLTSTIGPDFVYTITVQAHGKYLTNETTGQYVIDYEAESSDTKAQMDYYVNQLSEVDDFIGELLCEYSEFEEPTVIVFFGDHLPALELKSEDLKTNDLYKTEYVIWANFPIESEDQDLEANMLASKVTSVLGLTNGVINKLNTYFKDDENFESMSKMLAYDILYGENFAKAPKHEPTNMTMGLDLIKLSECYFENGTLYVKGEHFNQNSRITIDRSVRHETEFIDSNTLAIENFHTFKDNFTISVAQVTSDNTVLGTANKLLCEAPK